MSDPFTVKVSQTLEELIGEQPDHVYTHILVLFERHGVLYHGHLHATRVVVATEALGHVVTNEVQKLALFFPEHCNERKLEIHIFAEISDRI